MSKVRPTKCPYCQADAIFDEDKKIIICELCDAEYKVTKEGGAKVKKLGVLDDLQNRVSALEAAAGKTTADESPEPTDESDNEDSNETTDEEIFPE